MEDLGDFLYIIFAIIGVVFSLLTKNKKAKKATPPIKNEVNDPFEENQPSFENIFGTEKPPGVKPEAVKQPEKSKTEVSIEEKKKQMDSKMSRIKSKKRTKEEEVEMESLDEGISFNLREAVIYSEILKRPEL